MRREHQASDLEQACFLRSLIFFLHGDSHESLAFFVRDDNGTPIDRCDDGWILHTHLTPTYCNYGIRFGGCVRLEEDRLVIGAQGEETPPDDVRRGSVYIFERAAGSWTQTAYLTLPDGGEGAYFGAELALDGEQLLVGAPILFSPC